MKERKLTEGSNLPAGWTGHNSLLSRLDGVVRSRVVSKTRWLGATEVTSEQENLINDLSSWSK